jgi:hypothetical protein
MISPMISRIVKIIIDFLLLQAVIKLLSIDTKATSDPVTSKLLTTCRRLAIVVMVFTGISLAGQLFMLFNKNKYSAYAQDFGMVVKAVEAMNLTMIFAITVLLIQVDTNSLTDNKDTKAKVRTAKHFTVAGLVLGVLLVAVEFGMQLKVTKDYMSGSKGVEMTAQEYF